MRSRIMEKVLDISGKKVAFKSNGSLMLRYKAQFGRDFLADFGKLQSALSTDDDEDKKDKDKGKDKKKEKRIDFTKLDTEVFFNIAWTMAKTADPSIPSDVLQWLDEFESFPVFDIFKDIVELINANFIVDRKNV
jgi:hypothetical protein